MSEEASQDIYIIDTDVVYRVFFFYFTAETTVSHTFTLEHTVVFYYPDGWSEYFKQSITLTAFSGCK